MNGQQHEKQSSQSSQSQTQLRQIRLFSATAAQSLTRSLPHGVPANILLLSEDNTGGAGQDVRSFLFTCYAERGLPSRGKIRVTSCHESPEVVGRDVLFLSLLLDGGMEEDRRWEGLWELYHSLFVDGEVMDMVAKQTEKLLVASSGGLEPWKKSEYGGVVDFIDYQALQEVRQVWEQYQHASLTTNSDRHDDHTEKLLSSMLKSKKFRDKDSANVQRELSMSGLRSTAPIPLAGRDLVRKGYEAFWDHELQEDSARSQRFPNPLMTTCLFPAVTGSIQKETKVFHYATSPLLGYHLGTALARLAPESPYSVKSSDSANTDQGDRVLAAIKLQLREWASAFLIMAREGHICVQYAVGNSLDVLDSMSAAVKTSTLKTISAQFDVIDTSTLADERGFLELLISARPLLKPSPISILYTECLKRTPSLSYKDRLEELMCGDVVVNSMVLGLSPVEYWSNTSLESCIDDVLIQASYDGTPSELLQNHFKASWRLLGSFCMVKPGIVQSARFSMESDHVVTMIYNAFNGLAKSFLLGSTSVPPAESGNRVIQKFNAFKEVCRQSIQTDWEKVHLGFLDRIKESNQSLTYQDTLASKIENMDLSDGAVSGDQNEDTAVTTAKDSSRNINLVFEATRLSSFTIRIEIKSDSARTALQDGALVKLHQTAPYYLEVMVGDYLLSEKVFFPVPVLVSKTTTHIARKSGYIDIVTRVVDPIELEEMTELVFPAAICEVPNGDYDPRHIPVILNNHSINLDSLPIISVDNESEAARKANSWLGTLTSQQFSKRERKERELAHEDDMVATSTRLNLKEAIFTMFMLASGLQGGSTGLFALSHPTKGNQMLIFVRALRLDASVGSVIADAAVLPITRELLDSGELETFLLVLRELDACVIDVIDEELALWKQMLPALVERCRTWEHVADCLYARDGRVPLTLDAEAAFLCNCGHGKLPDQFMGGLPEWDVAAQYAVRVAISPLFAIPWIEEIMDVEMVRAAGGIDGMDVRRDRCRSCGAFTREGETASSDHEKKPLLRCTRCRSAMYCSQACQKKDWKKHRAECQPPS